MPKEGVGAMSHVLTRHIPHTLGAEESSRVCWAGAGHALGILGWQERDTDSNGLGNETQHVRVDVAEQGTSREKHTQAGTAPAVAWEGGYFQHKLDTDRTKGVVIMML